VLRLTRTLALAGILVAAAAPAAHAQESTAKDKLAYLVFADYAKDGTIDPCAFSTEQLKAALGAITPDIRQYASDFPGAIKAAIAARARGACGGGAGGSPEGGAGTAIPGGGGAATQSPTAAATRVPADVPTRTVVPEPPGPAGDASQPTSAVAVGGAAASLRNGPPAPLIGLGVLAVLLAFTALLLFAMRRLGFGEGRLAPVYHSWREAGWRAGGVWADFRDWLRVGR